MLDATARTGFIVLCCLAVLAHADVYANVFQGLSAKPSKITPWGQLFFDIAVEESLKKLEEYDRVFEDRIWGESGNAEDDEWQWGEQDVGDPPAEDAYRGTYFDDGIPQYAKSRSSLIDKLRTLQMAYDTRMSERGIIYLSLQLSYEHHLQIPKKSYDKVKTLLELRQTDPISPEILRMIWELEQKGLQAQQSPMLDHGMLEKLRAGFQLAQKYA